VSNRPGAEYPSFRRDEEISAKKLNQLAQAIVRTIKGAPPIKVRTTTGGITISLSRTPRTRGGSGGGTTGKWFRITVTYVNGTYEGLEVNEPERINGQGNVSESGAEEVFLYEANQAPGVPVGAFVWAVPGVDPASGEEPYYVFSLPLGC
jgi:hypothetical protein